MARYSTFDPNRKGPDGVYVMTRQQFKDSPAYTLLNLEKPIYITLSGQRKWVCMDIDKYDKMIEKMMELATGGRR